MRNTSAAFSEGARYERKAILSKVRRELRQSKYIDIGLRAEGMLKTLEGWILTRQKRYEPKSGGLGRKK